MSIALLLAGSVSVAPTAATVAVLDSGPLAPALTVPLIVSVSVLAAPGARLALVTLTVLPDDALVPQAPVPVTTQAVVTPVIAAGTRSVMSRLPAWDGPPLVTAIVYVMAVPGT